MVFEEVYWECLMNGAILIVVNVNSDGTITAGVKLRPDLGGGSAMVTAPTDHQALMAALRKAKGGD